MKSFGSLTAAVMFIACAAQGGLVSLWKAEGNTNDSAGPNNGTAVGVVQYTGAQSGQGFLLQKTGYIEVLNPVAGGLQSPSGFTVAAWIRIDGESAPFGTGSIANLRTTANHSGFTLEQWFGHPTGVSFAVCTSGAANDYVFVQADGWTDGVLAHIAATFDAATHTMVLYRNGLVVGSRSDVPNSTMATDALSQFQIGRNIVNAAAWFGVIDELQLYNTALTQAQIQRLYCPADFNRDGVVDDADFIIFVASYNILDCADPTMPPACPGDLNNDAVVDDADFVIFLSAYNGLLCS